MFMDEHLKHYGRHGPQKDRKPKYSKEENRARSLARARAKYEKMNEKRRAKKYAALQNRVETLCAEPFPSGLSDKLK